ncbi:helix-turn-helix transcriptional regulator [Geopsychrobacter electrodiphilus]|uniref:helix-turn-helix transcriptional regulator n=1 Tax=Geopsychrobacter electrodiphilus TaxID=225196 RepID=UPI00037D5061|nr:transcriptional regulator [Geopsychrobacter electrodiphilus]
MKNRLRKPGKPAKKYSQAARLHDVIRILEQRFGATVEELVEECQVTRRTVYRDLVAIEEAGYPLIKERQDSGEVIYRFVAGFKNLPPITFSLEELMTLYLCRGQLDFLQGTPFQEDLDAVFNRLRSGLPARSVAHLERIAEAGSSKIQGFRDYSGKREILTLLRQALLKQQRCKIRYAPARREAADYLFDPYTLLFYNSSLYLGGYAHNRKALRLFLLDRIEAVSPVDDRFEVPDDYRPAQLTGSAFGLIDEGPERSLDLLFAEPIAHLIRERIWHPQQQLEECPDGAVRLQFSAAGDTEILSWLFSMLPHVQILGPETLREKFLQALRQTLEKSTV